MVESDKYKLSTYQTIEKIRETDTSVVEVVECSLDGKKYIKKTYHSDKRLVFQTLAQINSAHIPHIFEVFFTDDTIVVEEFIEGSTLEQLISEKHIFTKKDIDIIANGLLDAISALHGNNLIHRDIKPGNIIVTPDGQAVLIDYSITRPYSADCNKDTELFGTIGYAAPEQFGFSQSDYRTDIYAFGVTMKLILTHRNVSKHLYDAVVRCTEFDPSRRFQSVDELKNYIKGRKHWRLTSIVILCAIGFCLVSTATIHLWPSVPEPVKPEAVQSDTDQPDTDKPGIVQDELLYTPGSIRIVDTYNADEDIPCLQMWEDRTYHTEISLSESAVKSQIVVNKTGGKLEVSVDDSEVMTFEKVDHPSTASYPNGEVLAELVFYDLNKDGNLEIIPIICDAVVAQYGTDPEVSLLINYTMGWCIYYNAAGYQVAEGGMTASLDPFRIYASAPGCLWVDFPSYYVLIENELILKS